MAMGTLVKGSTGHLKCSSIHSSSQVLFMFICGETGQRAVHKSILLKLYNPLFSISGLLNGISHAILTVSKKQR